MGSEQGQYTVLSGFQRQQENRETAKGMEFPATSNCACESSYLGGRSRPRERTKTACAREDA